MLIIKILLYVIVLWNVLAFISLIGTKWAMRVHPVKRPPILNEPHGDWKFFKKIPRALTAFLSLRDPIKILGTAPFFSHFDMPPLGTWVLAWPLFICIRTKSGWLYRDGARRDYVDNYYQWPSGPTLKRRP